MTSFPEQQGSICPTVRGMMKYAYSFFEAGAFSTAETASASHLSSMLSTSPLSQAEEIAGSMGSLPRTLRPYPAATSS